ncbi:MAG: ABC transporter substrate-binding protein [Rhodospirillales bacterium]
MTWNDRQVSRGKTALALGTAALAMAGLALATPAAAEDTVKLGVVSFLTGAAAGPFGIPGKNAAELVIDAINEGSLPAPYDSVGLAGMQIEPVYVDEAGGTTTQVTEMRNLVQRENVDAIVGYISSGSCLAVAPVAEELQVLTVFWVCGTPRIFEEAKYKYVFRTAPHATMDNVAAARYVLHKMDDLESYAGLNQNYAFGQDSWRDFVLSMKALAPEAEISGEYFPKIFAGEYGSEISALLVSGAQVLHSSFWGGDLESFLFQSIARGLPQRMPFVLTSGEPLVGRIGDKIPDGTIIGARGEHADLAPESALNTWLKENYEARFDEAITYPAYHMTMAILGVKAAYDKAAAEQGGKPSEDQVIAAFEYMEYDTPSGKISMSLGDGHQAVAGTAYATFSNKDGEAKLVDIVRYPAECVQPPAGVSSIEWLEQGMPGAKC